MRNRIVCRRLYRRRVRDRLLGESLTRICLVNGKWIRWLGRVLHDDPVQLQTGNDYLHQHEVR